MNGVKSLAPEQVREIRRLFKHRPSVKEVAAKFNVPEKAIRRVIRKETYKKIGDITL